MGILEVLESEVEKAIKYAPALCWPRLFKMLSDLHPRNDGSEIRSLIISAPFVFFPLSLSHFLLAAILSHKCCLGGVLPGERLPSSRCSLLQEQRGRGEPIRGNSFCPISVQRLEGRFIVQDNL
jgi:hypothetical protein